MKFSKPRVPCFKSKCIKVFKKDVPKSTKPMLIKMKTPIPAKKASTNFKGNFAVTLDRNHSNINSHTNINIYAIK